MKYASFDMSKKEIFKEELKKHISKAVKEFFDEQEFTNQNYEDNFLEGFVIGTDAEEILVRICYHMGINVSSTKYINKIMELINE